MKKFYFLVFFGMMVSAYAQVGIGTPTPEAALDVTSATNGFLVPRVALTAANTAAPVVNPQGTPLVIGTLVWNTTPAGIAPNNVVPGYHYWDGTRWITSQINRPGRLR